MSITDGINDIFYLGRAIEPADYDNCRTDAAYNVSGKSGRIRLRYAPPPSFLSRLCAVYGATKPRKTMRFRLKSVHNYASKSGFVYKKQKNISKTLDLQNKAWYALSIKLVEARVL